MATASLIDKLTLKKMNITTVEKTAYRRMMWVNGGGETTELYSQVESDSGRILWRISMADVSSSGPFSLFDGCDRILVLLDGHGLCLSYKGEVDCELRQRYDLAEFPGDVDTFATIRSGPIRNFNVIADRSRFRLKISIVHDGDSFRVLPNANIVTVYSADHDVVIESPNKGSSPLLLGDLLVIENPEDGAWRVDGATTIVAQLFPPGLASSRG